LPKLRKPRPNDQSIIIYCDISNTYANTPSFRNLMRSIRQAPVVNGRSRKRRFDRPPFSMLSSRLTRTDAGDHHSRGRYPKPDRRNGSAERKTSRSHCRPWRHRRRWRRTEPMPGSRDAVAGCECMLAGVVAIPHSRRETRAARRETWSPRGRLCTAPRGRKRSPMPGSCLRLSGSIHRPSTAFRTNSPAANASALALPVSAR